MSTVRLSTRPRPNSRAAGYQVTNPAEKDTPTEAPWIEHMRADVKAMMDCDGVALLDGWSASRGANIEGAPGARARPARAWRVRMALRTGAPADAAHHGGLTMQAQQSRSARVTRRPQRTRVDNLVAAMRRATRLTASEVAQAMAPLRAAECRLREGVATADQWAVVNTAMLIAREIEKQGVVRGLREHLDAALQALASIEARAMPGTTWAPTALWFYELDAVREGLRLHQFQLEQLSFGELHAATSKVLARHQSAGGAVEARSLESLGLVAKEPSRHDRQSTYRRVAQRGDSCDVSRRTASRHRRKTCATGGC
ncbi:DUF4406 domain-containing protein [Acidovorax citrulli]|nr:DUF4406 domain-containing protein [Paracidovorax citrulli]